MFALGQRRAAQAAARAPIRARPMMATTSTSTTSSSVPPSRRPLCARAAAQQQQKGFGSSSSSAETSGSGEPAAASSSGRKAPSGNGDDAALERLEARLKSRRQAAAKLEPQVKVESAAVKLGTGQAPGEAGGAAETLYVQFLGALFVLILVEGLVLAASGFLPESFDAAVTDWLYPSYSPQILLFLGMSSLYGLFKTGKLPGQKQL